MDSSNVSRIAGSYQTYEEAVWTRRGTWGAIVLGALMGLALTFVLGTVGAATGLMAGAEAADKTDDDRDRMNSSRSGGSREDSGAVARTQDRAKQPAAQDRPRNDGSESTADSRDKAGKGAAGAAVWVILTALFAGLAGGWVAGRVAQVFEPDVNLLAVTTWAVGIVMFYALATLGASGLAAGVGAGAERFAGRGSANSEDVRQAAIASGAALWILVAGHAVGFVATLLGARGGMKRRKKLYPAGDLVDRQEGRPYSGPTGSTPLPARP